MCKDNNMGRFIWIYFFSALVAAPLAGFIAKQLLVALKHNQQRDDAASEDEDKRKPLMDENGTSSKKNSLVS